MKLDTFMGGVNVSSQKQLPAMFASRSMVAVPALPTQPVHNVKTLNTMFSGYFDPTNSLFTCSLYKSTASTWTSASPSATWEFELQ